MRREKLRGIICAFVIVGASTFLSTFLTYSQKSSFAILALITLFSAVRFHAITAIFSLTLGLIYLYSRTPDVSLRDFFFEVIPIIGVISILILLYKRREDENKETELQLKEERKDKYSITEALAKELKARSHVLNIGAQYLKTNGNEFEKFDKAVEILTSNAEVMDQTLEKVIAISGDVQGNKIRINPLPLSLKKILLSSLPADTHFDFQNIGGDSLWDEGELQKVFQILLKATNELGMPQITFNEKKDHAKILFTVKELLTPSEISGLNEPFHSEVQKKFNNALIGLDMNLARGIVEAHGGNLKVFSTLHEGTVFTILLPKKKE